MTLDLLIVTYKRKLQGEQSLQITGAEPLRVRKGTLMQWICQAIFSLPHL